MNYKAVKIYVYDKELMKLVINDVSTFIKENNSYDNCFIIQRGWVYGLHLKIICGNENMKNLLLIVEELIEFLRLKKVEWSKRDHIELDYLKLEKTLAKIAQLERYKGDYLPLEQNLKIIEENFEINNSEMKDVSVYLKEEMLKSEFIVAASNHYYNLNADKKILFLLNIFTIMGDFTSSINKNVKDAINESYLSFKSHVEGFKGQLNNHSDNMKTRILDTLNNVTSVEKDYIDNQFKKILCSSRDGFNHYNGDDKEILMHFQKILFELDDMYVRALEDNKINFSDEQSLTTFLEENTDHISNFHKDIMRFMDLAFYNSKEFLLGRLLSNWLYSLLPLFSISPLLKHKLCNLICLSVEKEEGKTYTDFIHMFNNTLEGGVRK